MTYLAKPKFHHPDLPKNSLGYTHRDYEGTVSTLCAGCGHDSITGAIIQSCFELSIEPHRVAKISGIGCSSKTPTYFLGNSHGFNSVHGRMPSVLTGANLANRELIYLGNGRPRLEIEARRHQYRQFDRPGGDGAAAGRQLCRALVLGRQAAAGADHQGGDRA